ncbi:MAG TPA: HAMP domain-containing sensor histidine kinase [Caulobacteraceae bacterium]|nr:HAMP domain-containing sensor histidine kinase [Caulobacteraceae bacterium]
MADDAPLSDPAQRGGRRVLWPGGLSARLLLATLLVVVLANAVVFPVLLANRQRDWLSDRIAAGELASFVVAVPEGKVTERVKQQILKTAGLVAVNVQADGVMRSVLAPTKLPRTVYRIDLRQQDLLSQMSGALDTLFGGGDRMVLVIDRPHYLTGELVEILVPDAPLQSILVDNARELLLGAVLTSIMAGALVYLFLNVFLIRPIQRITRSMESFRADPEDPAARLKPSGRHDEIGRAENELDRMQLDLSAALASRARLAALGEAVAKINHEMRNMLTSAQLASERLATSGDPVVARTLPRLERALERAAALAANVLTFGRSEEPPPAPRPVALRVALESAAEDAQLSDDGVKLVASVDDTAQVLADPDQLHRILVNLMRNAREAIEGAPEKLGHGALGVSLTVGDGASVIRVTDDGPGLPERARANLFRPFEGGARRGGAGLGLAISRELAQAHGGDLVLAETGPAGTVFDLRLPGAPDPLPRGHDGRKAAEADA